MEVKPGYKQTEVGVIPEDWQVCHLGELGKLEMGKGLLKDDISSFGDFPAIPYTSLYTDFSEVVERKNIKWFVDKNNASYVVNSPCVLLASSSNVSANTGKACALADGFPVAVGREVITLTTKQNVIFISYLLGTNAYRKKTLDSAKGITIKHVYPTTFVNYKIALPPAPEQSAIATVLSDMAALLDGLDRLIAKKRAIKQATMQQLLTGQTRLPGFSGEWEVKRLGDFVSIRNQKVLPTSVAPETLCVELEHIGQSDGRLLTKGEARNSSAAKYRFQVDDILFGRLRSYLRKYWLATEDGICTTEIWPLMFDLEKINSGFLFALVQTDSFIEAASISYGTHMPRADWSVVRNHEIHLPSKEEQAAIATVLSDMDTEITALETRRIKTRALKQAMMQELLTGRTRLV